MPHYKKGPIEYFTFGRFVINGVEHAAGQGCGKDIRLIGGEVTPWAERQGHSLKPEMVTGVYGQGIDVLIIGCGADSALKCSTKTLRKIRRSGIRRVEALDTARACRVYNRLLRKGVRVALLAHGTC